MFVAGTELTNTIRAVIVGKPFAGGSEENEALGRADTGILDFQVGSHFRFPVRDWLVMSF